MYIKLHKAYRLALPAAKLKKEEEEEEKATCEPCGPELLMGARCPGAEGRFVKLSLNTLLSLNVEPQAGDATEIYGQKTFQITDSRIMCSPQLPKNC